jgi:hypothetical protein
MTLLFYTHAWGIYLAAAMVAAGVIVVLDVRRFGRRV